MDLNDPAQRRAFFEVHQDLPREGPGNRESTMRALDVVIAAGGSPPARVLDIGCGPGMQTLDLAGALPDATLLALDLHERFLHDLGRRAADAGCADGVHPVRADMTRLPVADAAVDAVWCEGAAYIMGVDVALEAWLRVLRSGGFVAFTEAVWLKGGAVPEPVHACWQEYPGMGDVEHCRALIRQRGYTLLDDFVLPPEAWWDDYYVPMEARLRILEERADEPGVAPVLAACREEIDICRRFGDWYGYAFFIARKPQER